MADFDQKQNMNAETSESFCPLRPSELNSHNHQVFSQIQEMTALLAQKKSKLRDLKWEANSLKGKYEQQDRRIMEVKSDMNFQIQKEEIQVANNSKYKELQSFMETDIKKLCGDIEYLKNQLTMYYDEIMNAKKDNETFFKQHRSLENQLYQLQQGTRQMEDSLVQKDNQIIELQSLYRERQEEHTMKQIQLTDLQSLRATYEQKNLLGKRQLHAEHCKNRQLQTLIQTNQDKNNNLKKQFRDTTWQYEKIEVHNKQIREINDRLKNDLEAVQKHLASIRKTNQILRNNIEEFSNTAHKVAKLVTFDKHVK